LVTFIATSCGAYWRPVTSEDVAPLDVDRDYLEGTEVRFLMADSSVVEMYVTDVDSTIVRGTALVSHDTLTVDLVDVADIATVSNTVRPRHIAVLFVVVLIMAIIVVNYDMDFGSSSGTCMNCD